MLRCKEGPASYRTILLSPIIQLMELITIFYLLIPTYNPTYNPGAPPCVTMRDPGIRLGGLSLGVYEFCQGSRI